jgi:uncharacterized protein (TIGR02300 family)
VAKPEWGVKRTCQSCSARFYDLARQPILCPKCGVVVEPEVTFKVRRQSAPAAEPKVAVVARAAKVIDLEDAAEELEVVDGEEGAIAVIDEGEEDENALIEDASDLGEDDDDMAEVMEHIDEDLENEI